MLSTEMHQLGFPPLEFEMTTYKTVCTYNFCYENSPGSKENRYEKRKQITYII